MRIVAFSDSHGSTPDIGPCDVLIICGDVLPLGPGDPIELLNAWLESFPAKHVLFTPGNHDIPIGKVWVPRSKHIHNMLAQTVNIEGLTFAGFGYCYCANSPELEQVWARMTPYLDVIKRELHEVDRCDILISHSPPEGVLDRMFGNWPIGVPGLLEKCIDLGIKQVFCGHVHEQGGRVDTKLGVKVVNCAHALYTEEINPHEFRQTTVTRR